MRRIWRGLQVRVRRLCLGLQVRLEFVVRDFWVGVYWEYRPHPCDFEVCYNNRVHVWVCLLPMLPLHVSWLVRREGKT